MRKKKRLLLCKKAKDMWDDVKGMVGGGIMAVIAYLEPIRGEEMSLLTIFVLNFFAGYLSGMLVDKEPFSLKKALRCIGEATVFFVLCAVLFFIGDLKGEKQGALQCISFISYTILYFYALNILKNLKKILKRGTSAFKVVAFLYYILSVEFIKHVPLLSNYINITKNIENEKD